MSGQEIRRQISRLIKEGAAMPDARRHRRSAMTLSADIVLPDGGEVVGTITDISAGGAFVQSLNMPIPTQSVTLRIERIGEVEAEIARVAENGFGAKFTHKRAQAALLADRLTSLINGELPPARLITPHVGGHITMASGQGQILSARVVDLSAEGAFVLTEARPAIGTTIRLGRQMAVVASHGEAGIGVTFATRGGTDF